MKTPRPYQVAADAANHACWRAEQAILDVLATGTGKTHIAVMAALRRAGQGRCLFICHREELVWQAAAAFGDAYGVKPAVEMGEYTERNTAPGAAVVVTTVQTQYSGEGGAGRMTRFDPADFATVGIDEAHHYVAPKYREVIDYYAANPAARLLGLTATPDRADRLAMGRLFKAKAYEYDIRQGIDDGWLVPVDSWTGTLAGMDLANVRTVAGDLNSEQLADVMERHGNVFGAADKIVERVGDRRTLIFCASVRHAELMAAILNDRRPRAARCVNEKTPTDVRRDMLAVYAAGGFQYLVNVGIATEGFDDYGIECVVILRPTKSRALLTQMIGRGSRPAKGLVDLYEHADDRRVAIAESWKPAALVVDFSGNLGRHKLITVADVLGGDYDTEVVSRVKARALDAAAPIAVDDALRAEWARLQAEREAAKQAELARLAKLRVNAGCLFEQVDLFDDADRRPARPRGGDPDRVRRPTDKMLRYLRGHAPRDCDVDALTFGEAGKMLGEITRRRERGQCTLKQSRVLDRYGLPADVPMARAKEWLDRIANNGWRLPPDLAAMTAAAAERTEVA